MKKIFLLSIFLILSTCHFATAQTVTISQSAADAAANCLREQGAKNEEIAALKTAHVTDSQLIENLKAQNNILLEMQKNDAAEKKELRAAIVDLVKVVTKPKKCFLSIFGC